MCKKKFSFIELLIVFSIISILLSLLQPSLKKFITQAHQTKCLYNLKKQSALVKIYVEDNETIMPISANPLYGYWSYLLFQYTSDLVVDETNFSTENTIFECVSKNITLNLPRAKKITGGYGHNYLYLGYLPWHYRKSLREQSINDVQLPGQTIFSGDSIDDEGIDNEKYAFRFGFLYSPSTHNLQYTRHNFGLNITFLDGSASFMDYIDYKNGKNGDLDYYLKKVK